MNPHSPIGIFDSGLGGLSVLKSLQSALPFEDFLYLGDVARLPYGTKSEFVVRSYARSCARFLLHCEVKHIVVACNTASAMALRTLREECGVGIHGVIEPGARAALATTVNQKILVLATPSTVASGAYRRELSRLAPNVMVEELPCPILVPLAEQGWFDHSITDQVVATYLAESRSTGYDTVVLGCTHYPLLHPSIRRVVKPEVALVHAGEELARELSEDLLGRQMLNPSREPGKLRLVATDRVSESLPILKVLFGRPHSFEVVDL